MSTLPRKAAGSSARWLLPVGVLLLAGGAGALVASGNEDAVRWLQESATCNERPCTYEETENIMLGIGGAGALAGAVMVVIGLWQLLRGGSASPRLPSSPAPMPIPDAGPPQQGGYGDPVEPAPAPPGTDTRSGFPDQELGSSPADRLTALDAELASGRVGMEDYLKRRERILREM